MVLEERSDGADEASLFVSGWLTIDQDRITAFGNDTNDPDPLHIDPAFAADHGPYGRTMSFGFLTMSLLTFFHHEAMHERRTGYALNYGFDRLRLPEVVLVGSRLRGSFRRMASEDRGSGRTLLRLAAEVQIEGKAKPALAAEWLVMWVDDGVLRPAPLQGV